MSKIKINDIFNKGFTTVLVTGDLFVSNSLDIKEESEIKEGAFVANVDDISIHIFTDDEKLSRQADNLVNKLAFLTTPVSILRTYAKNIIHDFRGPLNGISATLKFIKEKVDIERELDDTMQAQLDEARKAINDNLALIGLGKPSELKIKDLKEIIEGFIHRYYNLSFELDVQECDKNILISKDVFNNSISLIFQQLLSFYEDKFIKLSLSYDKVLKFSIEVERDLQEFVEGLIFYENHGMMHSLCFLRLMVDKLSLANTTERSILTVEWDGHETN